MEWSLLPSNEKNHYKVKLNKQRSRYEAVRKSFFQAEDKLIKYNRAQCDAQQNTRYRLVAQLDQQHSQGEQLDRIKQTGLQTVDILNEAQDELQAQRHTIQSISGKTYHTQQTLTKTNRLVDQMSRRDFNRRLNLLAVNVLLAILIVLVALYRLGWF